MSETQLSVRNGLVRCGQCQEVFNASWNLVDEVPTAVTRQRETQEQDAVGVDAPRASTTEGGAPPPRRPAGGEQVELFGGDLAVKGRPKIQRRKRGAGPGGETELLPSAMPFAIVEDDTVPAERAERPAGSGEPLAEGVVEPVDDGEETAAGAPTEAVDHRPEAGETDEGVLAEVQGETPLDLADTEADIGSAVAGTLEIVESAPEADEPQSGVSPEGKEVDEKARPDEEHVAMDLQPRSAAEAQPDKEEPVTQEPSGHPTPQPDDDEPLLPGSSASAEEEHPALALQPAEVDEPAEEVATEPSLADLFAAAEEQLSQEDEGTANRREVSRSAPIGDLFAVADEAPSEEDDGTASGGEVNTEPAQPQVPEADDAGGGEPDHAEAKAPFDTPDAEEIVIEAPAMLWDAFRDEAPGGSGSDGQDRWDEQEAEADDAAAMAAKPGAATAPQDPHIGPPPGAGAQVPSQQSATAALGARLRQSRDMKLVHLPRRQPLNTAAWIVAAVVLVGVGLWQAKSYYLGSLSQVAALRPYVAALCDVLSCTVPPRSAFNLIDLVGTSVNTHPETPGALRVSVNLVNRAEFEQAYPPLEITLSDKSGRIVGRRTYLPEDYLTDPASLLVPKVIQEVDIDLAQPSENAVGYEIQLVAR